MSKPFNLEQIRLFAAAIEPLLAAAGTIDEVKENEEAPESFARLVATTRNLVAVCEAFAVADNSAASRSALRWALIRFSEARHAAQAAASRHSYGVFHSYSNKVSTSYRLGYEHMLKTVTDLPVTLMWLIEDMMGEDLHETQEWFESTDDPRANSYVRLAIADVKEKSSERARDDFPTDEDYDLYRQRYAQETALAAQTQRFVDLIMNTPVEELHAAMDVVECRGGGCWGNR